MAPVRADTPVVSTPITAPPKIQGPITIRKFQHLQWSPDGNYVRSQGSVEAVETDPTTNATTTLSADSLDYNLTTGLINATGNVKAVYTTPKAAQPTILTAQDVTYNTNTGQVNARGGVQLQREDLGQFTGQELQYSFTARTGYVTNAVLTSDVLRLKGDRIEALADGSYLLTNGTFTTCIRARPDYHVRARQLKVSPNQYVSAKGITFYAGATPLITLPTLRRSLRDSSNAPTPIPGYNKTDGLTLRMADTPIVEPHQTLDYDVRVNFRRLPTGFVAYQGDIRRNNPNTLPPHGLLPYLNDPLRGFLETLTPPTYREYAESHFEQDYVKRTSLFALLQNDQFVYNRLRNDIRVSRYPEVGLHFANILGHGQVSPPTSPTPKPGSTEAPPAPPVGSTEQVIQRIPNAPLLLDAYLSAAQIHERPSDVTAGRFGLRTNIASQPFLLGRRLSLRAGVTDWLHVYTTGTAYNLVAPEIALSYVPTRTSLFGVAYRYLADTGNTPFLFDRRDIRHELRFQYQVGGPWAFGVLTRIDLERSRAYDTEFAVLRNFDCMQVGVTYRTRSQSFNVIFSLLPPAPLRNRERVLPMKTGGADFADSALDSKPSAAPVSSALTP